MSLKSILLTTNTSEFTKVNCSENVKEVQDLSIVKVGFLNSVAIIIKMATLFFLNKILAIYVGPSGYATIGQFQNITQIFTAIATGAMNSGIVKYTAEYHEDEHKQFMLWQTAGSLSLYFSLFAAIIITIFNEKLAILLLHDAAMGSVLILFSFALVFCALNALLMSILQGKKEIKLYIVANILGSLFAFMVTAVMAIKVGLYGALIGLSIYQSLNFFATCLVCSQRYWFKFKFMFGSINTLLAKKLFRYSLMNIISTLCVPGSYVLIRNYIGIKLGWEAAGIWEAMSRISVGYLLIITSTLTLYYVPRYSELKTLNAIKKEILNGYKIIMPLVIAFALIMYMMKDIVIEVLFTNDFLPMKELFGWQMVGDCLKISAYICGYVFIGRAKTSIFIFSEVFFSLTLVMLTYVFVTLVGLYGASIAYSINYAMCLVFYLHQIKKLTL